MDGAGCRMHVGDLADGRLWLVAGGWRQALAAVQV